MRIRSDGQAENMILGGGPNRIGQGIEFDYCCVHAAMALKESGTRPSWSTAIRKPCLTDYDTSDRLYFESLTFEDVMEIIDKEKPKGCRRAVRWPDAIEACTRSAGCRCADYRNVARFHRSSRRIANDFRSWLTNWI